VLSKTKTARQTWARTLIQGVCCIALTGCLANSSRGDAPKTDTAAATTQPTAAANTDADHARNLAEQVAMRKGEITGTVAYYNLTPRGEVASIMVKTDTGLVQVDLPPRAGDEIAKTLTPGSAVHVTVGPMGGPNRERGRFGGPGGPGGRGMGGPMGNNFNGGFRGGREAQGNDDMRPRPMANEMSPDQMRGGQRSPGDQHADHPVLHALTISGADGKAIDLHPAPVTVHVDAKITHLNYNERGDVDGAMLDNDTFVAFGPMAARALQLEPGQRLIADGIAQPNTAGQQLLHATVVNGMAVPHPMMAGRGEFGPGGLDGEEGPGPRQAGFGRDGFGRGEDQNDRPMRRFNDDRNDGNGQNNDDRGPRGRGPANDGPNGDAPDNGGPGNGGPGGPAPMGDQ